LTEEGKRPTVSNFGKVSTSFDKEEEKTVVHLSKGKKQTCLSLLIKRY
jgi:hypothetical protein